MKKREVRFAGERMELRDKAGKPKIVGYAAVFNTLSKPLQGFRERIAPGTFRNAIQNDDVRALVDHQPANIIGRTKAGTLRLEEDEHGLRCEIDPPDTSVGRDVVESIRRGDLDQMSFGFRCNEDAWMRGDDGEKIRELRDVQLLDVSVVAFPAYEESGVFIRSLWPDGLPHALRKKLEKRNEDCECDCMECEDGRCEDCSDPDCTDPNCEGSQNTMGTPREDKKKGGGGKEEEDEMSVGRVGGDRAAAPAAEKRQAKTKRVAGKDLSASQFAFVGDKNDTSTWKLPIHDASHVRNALARFNQVKGLSEGQKKSAYRKILAAAKKFGIKVSEQNSAALYKAETAADARAILRDMNIDDDGDDDELLVDCLVTARRGCELVAATLSTCLWNFWEGGDNDETKEYTNAQFGVFLEQADSLIADLEDAIAEVKEEVAEPMEAEAETERHSKRTMLERIERMAELERD